MSKRLFAAAAAGLALSVLSGPAFAACAMAPVAELPVTLAGGTIQIPVQINGATVPFVVGTNTFYSVIANRTATDLKLARTSPPGNYSRNTASGGQVDLVLAQAPSFALGRMAIKSVALLVNDATTVRPAEGAPVGLLGQDLLGITDVEFDMSKPVIRLFRTNDCADAALAYWAGDKPFSVIPIKPAAGANPDGPSERGEQRAVAEAAINGLKVKIAISTASATTLVSLKAANRAGIRLDGPGVVTGSGSVKNWIVPVASFKIGDEEIRNTKLRVVDIDYGYADMIVGADFFLSHRVYFSNGQKKLYFTYGGGPVFNLSQTIAVAEAGEQSAAPVAAPAQVVAGPEPTDAEGFFRRAKVLAARRNYRGAAADLDRAVALNPAKGEYYVDRANVRGSLNQRPLALADLDKALTLAPKDEAPLLLLRSFLRSQEHDMAGAGADLDALERTVAKNSPLRLRMNILYVKIGRTDEALTRLDAWVSGHGSDATAFNARCLARMMANQELDKALDDCDRAVRLGRNTSAFIFNRGFVELRMGQFDKALADYDAALKLDPRSAPALYGRGLVKKAKGQAQEGEADIAAAVAITPTVVEDARANGLGPTSG